MGHFYTFEKISKIIGMLSKISLFLEVILPHGTPGFTRKQNPLRARNGKDFQRKLPLAQVLLFETDKRIGVDKIFTLNL